MTNIYKGLDFNEIIWKNTLNTFTFETWLHNWEPLISICNKKVDWSIIDSQEWLEQELSLKNRKEVWGENYKETNKIITTRLNWTTDEIYLPSFLIGWMWIDVSSLSLLEASSLKDSTGNGYFFSSHLSSIWISVFREPNLFEENGKWFEKYWSIIEKDFYDLFETKLWLTRDQINEHFLKVDENLNLDLENFNIKLNIPKKERKTFMDSSFQPTNKHWILFLMKDLTALYNDVKSAKDKWFFVPINHMYKSSSYISSIKVAALAWADAITTGAWIPRTWFHEKDNTFVQPRDIVSDFYKSIWKENHKMPAFWLVVSMTMAYAPWYDYYINEDPRSAWWHQWAFESMLPFEKRVWKENVLKSLRKREGIDKNVPIYAAGWINSASDIKELLDLWFNWIIWGTNFASTQEARWWEWEDFKKALISWNHFWNKTEIDKIAKKSAETLKSYIYIEMIIFRKKFEKIILWGENDNFINDIEVSKNNFDKESIYNVINVIEKQIFKKDNTWLEKLNPKEKEIYNILSEKLTEKYEWDIEKLREDLRCYWNILKAFDEFKRFEELGMLPTHLLFDSVVWFIGRLRIEWREHRLLNDTIMRSVTCVQCVTHCILRNTWWIPPNRWSKFCISDSLRIWHIDAEKTLVLNFSWRTTCFYNEIRPVKDIILAYAWTEVVR